MNSRNLAHIISGLAVIAAALSTYAGAPPWMTALGFSLAGACKIAAGFLPNIATPAKQLPPIS